MQISKPVSLNDLSGGESVFALSTSNTCSILTLEKIAIFVDQR
jgi:hypothetical protein